MFEMISEPSRHEEMSRRTMLKGAVALSVGASVGRADLHAADEPTGTGLIVRESNPPNVEMDFSGLDSFITPQRRVFTRCHFPVPIIDERDQILTIEGKVTNPLAFRMDPLRKIKPVSVTSVMECAGNGRVNLVPKVRGVAWDQGAVANVTWTGAPLKLLLEQAGVSNKATHVLFEGADYGSINDDPKSPGDIKFDRAIPIEKAMKDVVLAYKMNDEDLTNAHGYPLRAVVPGWYGMASVKWLKRIIVLDREYQGYWQSIDYSYFERSSGFPSLTPLTTIAVKAQISRPGRFDQLKRGTFYKVTGAAWSGHAPIAKIEFSNNAIDWFPCTLVGEVVPNAWRFFEYSWKTPEKPGPGKIAVRATDEAGNTQPVVRSPDRRTYMINHVIPNDVTIV